MSKSDDLISRQAVLDYIDNMSSELTADGRRMIRRIRLTEYIQDSLPSAQPEIIRCKDCEFYTEEEGWCRRLGLCGAFDPNGYCSHAERRTNETD